MASLLPASQHIQDSGPGCELTGVDRARQETSTGSEQGPNRAGSTGNAYADGLAGADGHACRDCEVDKSCSCPIKTSDQHLDELKLRRAPAQGVPK